MTHHRCSRCKQEVTIRHKRHGFLICEDCLRRERYSALPQRQWFGFFDIFRGMWDFLATHNPFQQRDTTQKRAKQDNVIRSRSRAQQMKATAVPRNAAIINPQKR